MTINTAWKSLPEGSPDHDLVSLFASYPHTSAELEGYRRQLAYEMGHIGAHREFYLLYDGQAPLATIQLLLNHADNDPELANGQDIAHLHALRVHCEHQGKGLGAAMLARIEDRSRQLGITTLTLGVDDWNHRAIALYKRCGFDVFKTEEGRTPDEACLLMRKTIGESTMRG